MMLYVLLSLAVAAMAVGSCFAQAQDPIDPRAVIVQRKIEYMDRLGGYYVRGVKPTGNG